jgi:hypothetical protein
VTRLKLVERIAYVAIGTAILTGPVLAFLAPDVALATFYTAWFVTGSCMMTMTFLMTETKGLEAGGVRLSILGLMTGATSSVMRDLGAEEALSKPVLLIGIGTFLAGAALAYYGHRSTRR